MIEISEAKKIINDNLPDRKTIEINIEDSLDYVAAKSILSPEPLPRFTNSSMDGFAVKWNDIKEMHSGENIKLKIIGESAAGNPFIGDIPNGTTIRINTGALLPKNVDTVIPIEDISEIEDLIFFSKLTFKGSNVRYKGEEIKKGDTILKENERITIPIIALLSSLGIDKVKVYKKPEIALIITGSELVNNTKELKPGQIRNSNSIMLKTAIEFAGGILSYHQNSKDISKDIKKAIAEASEKSDIIIISGGVSVGTHDLVKQVASELGFKQLFWRIRQKPGKPMYFAKKARKLLFGLPGNPVSSLNSFAYYIFPLIFYLRGKNYKWKKLKGILLNDIVNTGNRFVFHRAKIDRRKDDFYINVFEKQGSHIISSMSQSNGFIIVAPGEKINANEKVEINLYPWEIENGYNL